MLLMMKRIILLEIMLKNSDKLEGKASEGHILCALVAITHFLTPGKCEDDIVLMYGESVDMYFNETHKKDLKKKLEGTHKIIVDEEEYEFTIGLAVILPEGMGHILQDLPNNMGKQYVIDIGGGTLNFLSIFNGLPNDEQSFSTEYGMNYLNGKVRREFKRRGLGNIKPDLADSYINRINDNTLPKNIQEIIEECVINEQFKALDEELAIEGLNIHKQLEHYPLTCIGGGSELLSDLLETHYKTSNGKKATVVEAPLMANVRGFYTYGVAKYSTK